jgi:hypothetical protein
MGTTAVFAKVTHIGLDYATIQLTAEIVDTKNPKNSRPSIEFEVPKGVGDWLTKLGAAA